VRNYWRILLACLLPCYLAASQASAADESVKVRFTWKIKGEYAPFYMAQAKGLFAKRGLQVTMAEGAGGQAAMAALMQGQEDVVVAPGVYALSTVTKGMPIKLISLLHPASPLALFSHADNPIRVPKDLEGKKIAASFDTFTNYINVLCRKNSVDCQKVTKIRVNGSLQQPMFVSRQVDAFGGYLDVDWPLLQDTTPTELVYIDLTKYGMTIPGVSVVTSNEVMAKRPEVLRKFLAAVTEGMDMTRANVSDAADVMLKSWQVPPSLKVVKEQIQSTVDFTPIIPNRPAGWIEASTLEAALTNMLETKEIDEGKPLEQYFTNDFLPQ
jgi:NitT/TauT family transport system substrate-binding protein